MKKHPGYYLGAVFENHQAAEAAVRELRQAGVSEEHLGIIVRDPHEHDGLGEAVDDETLHAVEKGMAIGIPVGMLAGMAIMAMAVPGGVIGVGGVLAGAAAGIAPGAFFGGVFGLGADRALTEEEEVWEHVGLEGNHVLVAVHPEADRDQARAVLERNGGRIIVNKS
jgi:hypothetical protein